MWQQRAIFGRENENDYEKQKVHQLWQRGTFCKGVQNKENENNKVNIVRSTHTANKDSDEGRVCSH